MPFLILFHGSYVRGEGALQLTADVCKFAHFGQISTDHDV